MDFSGKRVLVTGSTMGIGRGAAEMFLEAGATVAINGRKPEAVAQVVAELSTPQARAVPGDVGTVDGCRSMIGRAIAQLGGLDVLVNNVGICPLSYLMDVTEEHWDEVIAVNLRSAFFCSQLALPELRRSKGNIVMVASVAGLTAGPTDSFVYAISKGGLVNMTRGLAVELARDGVRVNAVCPGYIDTPMIQAENEATGGQVHEFISNATPLGRLGTVRECASSILYLASSLAGYCTGALLVNDGGCIAAGSWGGVNAAAQPAKKEAPYVATPKPAEHYR
jgi:NAD(P)-dependent dehydrogenase (short-subunit alcohol dehydrogenase family)